jgi:hypothetical protein
MAGTPLLWVVFFGSLGVAGFGAVLFLSGETWGAAVALLGALASAASLVVQIRFSPRQTARVLGVPLLLGGGLTALIGFNTHVNPALFTGAGLFALAGASCLYGYRSLPNPVPGLTSVARASSFYESDGVHFLVGWNDQPVARGDSFIVHVVAQNVTTAPRRLIVRLDGVSEHAFEQLEHALPVEPGAVVSADVPFKLAALAEGTLRFAVDVSSRGEQNGVRLRREQGAEYVVDIAGANILGVVTFLTLGAGTFRWGGSKEVKLPVDVSVGLVKKDRPLNLQTLHAPAPGDVERAMRL